MENSIVQGEVDNNGIAFLTLNRPEYHNAFDNHLIQLLIQRLTEFDENPEVKVIILKANGKNFSAGADLNWMKRMATFTEEENLQDALQLANLLKLLSNCKKVTLALTQGVAMGGGAGLLSCCDMVIAEQQARFCFSEVKLGLIPATIAPYVIRAIGQRAARYYFLTAKFFSSQEAKQMGLVHEIVPSSTLTATGVELATTLLKNGPQALKLTKRLVTDIIPFDEELQFTTAALIAKVRSSKEAQEGLNAFFDKRDPSWIKAMTERE